MRDFGKSNGGGRRTALREQAPVLIVYFTLSRSDTAELVDVSPTGVRLRGDNPPGAGEEVVLTMEGIRSYGTVAWAEDDECGIAFDRPLPPGSLQRLRHSVALCDGLTPDMKHAFDQWMSGAVR